MAGVLWVACVARSATAKLKGAIGLPVRISLLPPIRRTLADYNLFNAFTTQDTRVGCTYSRYADDLTFSTNKKVIPREIATTSVAEPHIWTAGTELQRSI